VQGEEGMKNEGLEMINSEGLPLVLIVFWCGTWGQGVQKN
jgi:hypothetical protein